MWLVVLSESVPLTSNQELGVGRDSSGREAATLFSRSELRLAGSSGMVPDGLLGLRTHKVNLKFGNENY